MWCDRFPTSAAIGIILLIALCVVAAGCGRVTDVDHFLNTHRADAERIADLLKDQARFWQITREPNGSLIFGCSDLPSSSVFQSISPSWSDTAKFWMLPASEITSITREGTLASFLVECGFSESFLDSLRTFMAHSKCISIWNSVDRRVINFTLHDNTGVGYFWDVLPMEPYKTIERLDDHWFIFEEKE